MTAAPAQAAHPTTPTPEPLLREGLLFDRAHRAIARQRRHGGVVAIVVVAVDKLSAVRARLGHARFGEALTIFEERLTREVRVSDTVGRTAADSFVVVLERVGSVGEAYEVALRLVATIGEPLMIDNARWGMTASAGVALCTGTEDAVDVVARAGFALDEARTRGPGTCELFDQALQDTVVEALTLKTELRTATRDGGIVSHFQPIVELVGETPVAFEALARWQHPRRGLLAPDKFLALAEDIRIIGEVDRAILRNACREANGWAMATAGAVSVHVNLSAPAVENPALVEIIHGELETARLPAGLLTVEVTERLPVSDTRRLAAALAALKDLGVAVALDDFGAGHSSLAWLQSLPIDQLKIDRSLVSGLERSKGWRVTEAIVALARALDLAVVAEGIETQEQARLLREMGCEMGQGYLFGRPAPGCSAAAMLASGVRGA